MQDLYVPDCLFPTDNDLEIPTLRLDVQPKYCEIPFVCFGEQKRTFDMNGSGTLHFYTDDYRFTAVYEHPERILQHNPANIVEPNFSLFNETPIAFGLQNIYKKRQISRQMQEKGIGVFVDLNVAGKFYKLNLIGVPAGYSSFCTRGYSDRLHYLEFEHQLAKSIAGDNDLMFVVYGGGKNVKDYCKEHRLIYVNPIIDIKNKVKSARKKIESSIAFIEDDFNPNKLLEETTKNLFDTQVENFQKMIE